MTSMEISRSSVTMSTYTHWTYQRAQYSAGVPAAGSDQQKFNNSDGHADEIILPLRTVRTDGGDRR